MTVGGLVDTVFHFNRLCECHLYTAPRNNTLFKVNDYRVIFSHPSSKAKELDGLKNPEKYLEVLKALVKAKEQINKEKDIR